MSIYWYSGALIQARTLELPIDDPGLLYGATTFTTLRLYRQSLDHDLTNWSGHCDRLRSSIQTFGWQEPDWQCLRQGAEALLLYFPILRVTIFPDGREWITGRALPNNLTELQKSGMAAAVMAGPQFQRWLPAHKTGNYLSVWLAKLNAQQLAAPEAILVDARGNWLETSTGNLWGWRDGSWWTPPITAGILPGVVRSQLLNWLRDRYQPVREEPWSREIVSGFEALSYTNSVVEVIPIHTVIEGEGASGEREGVISYNPAHPGLEQLRRLFCT